MFDLFGYEVRSKSINRILSELTLEEKELFLYVINNNLTKVPAQRLFATIQACKYVLDADIAGDFIECGVWRGGNSIIAAGIFELYKSNKKVYLYDTFEGMTTPTSNDKDMEGNYAQDLLPTTKGINDIWCYASIDDVKNNFSKINLMSEKIIFIKGDVENTLNLCSGGGGVNENIPDNISVLRLDTDWYESTKKEMEVLYPKVTIGGVLLLDDYIYWEGAKKAVDEYFSKNGRKPLLHPIDYNGRLAIKI
jgi:hypothetical protein